MRRTRIAMRGNWRRAGCALGLGSWMLLAGLAGAQELPVQRVVIYKNGVAYVERTGPAPGGGSVTLSFRAEDMTDILKSMSVSVDGGCGGARSLQHGRKPGRQAEGLSLPHRAGTGNDAAAGCTARGAYSG